MIYDLLIKGGRVIDPAQQQNQSLDIAVNGDKITAVLPDIPAAEAATVIDASGLIVTPGLIDLHTHVCQGILRNGADPDAVGVDQGVTTVVDGGSAGHAVFEAFSRYVVPAASTDIYCFLHIGSFGLAVIPELWYPEEINPAATEAVISNYPDLIRGVKIRLVGKLIAREGASVVEIAQKTAKRHHLPLMVHIGDRDRWVSPSIAKEILPLLEAGDILSHIYTAHVGTVLGDDQEPFPELIEAQKRGVILDAANGINNCSYAVARQMLAKGLLPTTLSSDVTKSSLTGPVYGLTAIMSRFLALGLSLEDAVTMTTLHPARAISIDDRKGTLNPGMDADISILTIKEGRWRFPDSHQEMLEMTRLIRPYLTIKAGKPRPPKCVPIEEVNPH